MSFITEWVTNIILFVLLATVIDMLLPNSTFQKYAKLVCGLLLITVILTPVFKLVSGDFEKVLEAATINLPEEKNIENSIESQKKEIQASLDEYTLEKMAVQLKEDANKELIADYGVEIDSIKLSLNDQSKESFPDNLDRLVLVLKEADEESQGAVEAVSPVSIDTQQPLPESSGKEQVDTANIVSFLSGKWDVPEGNIAILAKGGE
ncbi:stage III sporulation protein AF [Niallia circulans]|uniref:Stage III sporulation protein AF n=1 Tax=Niallia circulans TaxID=1397 RepID=A0A553SKX9_NIACI|nr:stage III sporulation protein AF [Niallia circulans]TRZ37627.1 stage III sporulation protein AF [Niallia circulans]